MSRPNRKSYRSHTYTVGQSWGARNFSPETDPLQHFGFCTKSSKSADFVEIFDRIKNNKGADFGKPEYGALTRWWVWRRGGVKLPEVKSAFS